MRIKKQSFRHMFRKKTFLVSQREKPPKNICSGKNPAVLVPAPSGNVVTEPLKKKHLELHNRAGCDFSSTIKKLGRVECSPCPWAELRASRVDKLGINSPHPSKKEPLIPQNTENCRDTPSKAPGTGEGKYILRKVLSS